jgi:hypothetical protein
MCGSPSETSGKASCDSAQFIESGRWLKRPKRWSNMPEACPVKEAAPQPCRLAWKNCEDNARELVDTLNALGMWE